MRVENVVAYLVTHGKNPQHSEARLVGLSMLFPKALLTRRRQSLQTRCLCLQNN